MISVEVGSGGALGLVDDGRWWTSIMPVGVVVWC